MKKAECISLINKEIQLYDDDFIIILLTDIKNSIINDEFKIVKEKNQQLQTVFQNKNTSSSITTKIFTYLSSIKELNGTGTEGFQSKFDMNFIEDSLHKIIKNSIKECVINLDIESVKLLYKISNDNKENHLHIIDLFSTINNDIKQVYKNQEKSEINTNLFDQTLAKRLENFVGNIPTISQIEKPFYNALIKLSKSISFTKIIIQTTILTISITFLTYFIFKYSVEYNSLINQYKTDHEFANYIQRSYQNLSPQEKSLFNQLLEKPQSTQINK